MTNYPKIGIRPTIDGRQGGVREQLEDKTMALANAVKNLIEGTLKNGDGSPVECIISNTTIGRVGESAACAEQFERDPEQAVEPYTRVAQVAHSVGLGLNAGHDHNLKNLKFFKDHVPHLDEVSIGHALISDALYLGLEKTIAAYKDCLRD